MKRLLALLLGLGLLVSAVQLYAEDKPKDKAVDKDKEAKDKDAKDKDKDKDKEAKDKDKSADKGKTEVTEAEKKELEKLSGTFTVTAFEHNGEKTPEADLKKMKVVQKGAEWSFHSGAEVTKGTDRVYPDKKPKEIDSTYTEGDLKGKTAKGIYQIDGDTIKYCHADPGTDRPKEFATKEGSNTTLMILKRAKPGETAPETDKGKDKDKSAEKDKAKEKDKGKEEKDKEKKDKDKG